jgi:hypothetical protein
MTAPNATPVAVRRVVLRGSRFRIARLCADAGIPFAFDCEASGNTCGRVSAAFVPMLSKLCDEHPEIEGRFDRFNSND